MAETDPALLAFQLITEQRVQGVAVVDASGRLVANISASDLRLIQHHGAQLSVLFDAARDFVAACRAGSRVRPAVAEEGALAVGPEATFAEALLLMDRARAHRIYVVDAERHLLGVVSQIDLIRAVQSEIK